MSVSVVFQIIAPPGCSVQSLAPELDVPEATPRRHLKFALHQVETSHHED